MEFNLSYFGNDSYKLLKVMSNNQQNINGFLVIPLNQQEIANIAHYSKLKTNKLINELINIGCIDTLHSKGKYIITEKGHKVIHLMERNNYF